MKTISRRSQLSRNLSRRSFVAGSAAFTLATASPILSPAALAFGTKAAKDAKRILVGTGKGTSGAYGPSGSILSYLWDSATGTLTPEGVAAQLPDSTWLQPSEDGKYLYVASELSEFKGQPTGAVSSFKLDDEKHGNKLELLSQVNSASVGTCQCNVDRTGHTVIAVDYGGGSAISFVSSGGKLGSASWSQHYDGYPEGKAPVPNRQEAAHAHFASFSPDNKYAYINDLGNDVIHTYKFNAETAQLASTGECGFHPGAGPRTLHFHPNGKFAYCMNEIDSTVNVLRYDPSDGSLSPFQQIALLPTPTPGAPKVVSTGCDTVLTRDGRFAYFANRGDNFLMSCHIDPATGKLTPFDDATRTTCGGKTPRNFRLDPTERWILVANQDSDQLSVIARDPTTGKLANEARSVAAPRPMCIVFV